MTEEQVARAAEAWIDTPEPRPSWTPFLHEWDVALANGLAIS